MDYGGGNHQTANQGCIWLFGCGSKSEGACFGCTPGLSVTQKRRCSCSIRLVALCKRY